MFDTYQSKKVTALSLLTFMFWLIVLMPNVDVDKETIQEELETEPLESVKDLAIIPNYSSGAHLAISETIVEEEEVVEEESTQENVGATNQDLGFKEWSYEETYLLAKIAMAEAEGESLQGKVLVIMVILNRVESNGFPDTIEEVIMQEDNGVYQFSPVIPGGRWYTTEPNEECWEAVRIVQEAVYDYSEGALYFESNKNEDNWHSRNLEFLFQEGRHRFYK